MRQQALGAASPRLIKQRVSKRSFGVFELAAEAAGADVRLDNKPLRISQISRLGKAFHAQKYVIFKLANTILVLSHQILQPHSQRLEPLRRG